MKITYLGTAAAEGFPAVFCNCDHCREAKRLGGQNIRTRSQTLINADLLIDFPADTYSHFLHNNIDGDKIQYLLVTHSHLDHFYVDELQMRHGAFAHNMRAETLQIYCGTGVAEKIQKADLDTGKNIALTVLKPFDTVKFGSYTATALPARHHPGDGALMYIIQGDKTILYAHDTGYFHEEVFNYLQSSGLVLDLVSLDCTNVDIPISDKGSHMGLPNIERAVNRLTQMGAITPKTQIVINHFSHNAEPLQSKLETRVAPLGYLVAYDGFSVEV